MSSKYTTCPKCKVRHSTLVKHKCFKTKKDKAPKLEEVEHEDMEMGGPTVSTAETSGDCISGGDADEEGGAEGGDGGEAEGDAEGEGDGAEEEGDGEAEGDGESESDGDGEEGGDKPKRKRKGDGEAEDEEGDGEGEGEGEGPQPQPPEPEAPPVAVVCTVLKFAALCAQCAKYGSIEITLTEDGLFVYGHNGDLTAYDTIPWGEFEKRSTLDGEYYVKEVIDGVDAKLNEADDKARLEALIQQAKDAAKAKPKALTEEVEELLEEVTKPGKRKAA